MTNPATTASTEVPIHPWNNALWQRLTAESSSTAATGSKKAPPQAILLSGMEGLGKRQLATQYAAHILQNDTVFYHGNHPDCHVLKTENELIEGQLLSDYAVRYIEQSKAKAKAKTVITVDQVRRLIEQVNQFPQMAEYKVILIDGADKMNTNAANALLKTLEEPVSKTCFVLICDHMEKLPITIKSRCLVVPMQAPASEMGMQWLQQQTDEPNLEAYLAMAGRAPLLALDLLNNDHIQTIREIFTQLNALWANKKSALDVAKEWQKHDAHDVVDMLQKLLIDVGKFNIIQDHSDVTALNLFFPVQKEWISKIAENTNKVAITNTLNATNESKRLLSTPADDKLIIENLAFNFAKIIETTL